MKKIRTWYAEWGNNYLTTDRQRRSNRFVNYAHLTLLFLILVFETLHWAVRCPWHWHSCFQRGDWDLTISGGVLFAIISGALVLKNAYGQFSLANGIALFSTLAYFTVLALSLPVNSLVYLTVGALLIFPFAAWSFQKNWLSILQITSIAACLGIVAWYPGKQGLNISQYLSSGISYTAVTFFIFAICAFGYFATKLTGFSERQFQFERDLRQRLLTTMIPELQRSEQRYSHLVEDAIDIVFSLNEQFEFKMINRTVKKLLQYDPGFLVGKKLTELVVSDGEDDLDRQLLKDNLITVLTQKVAADLRVAFQAKHNLEPVTMQLTLSYSESEGQGEILGKASPLTEDKLNSFIESERSVYLLDNSLSNAEDLTRRLTRNLHNRLSPADLTVIRVALREILINAIEHGNLNVTFDEKTQVQLEGRYLEFLRERQNDPRYLNRRVRIEYVLKPQYVAYKIVDEGSGFDFSLYTQAQQEQIAKQGLQHGRGIHMSRNAFDRVQYLAPGNKVILFKRFST